MTHSGRNRSGKLEVIEILVISNFLGIISSWSDRVQAQIIPDDSLGAEASIVTPNVEIKGELSDRIDGGALRDSNLFHSFEQFSIGDLQRVYFANPAGISNIFSRVTGSNLSEIFGTLGVNGNANLFFINPNGIIFGENASLDVGGSFVGSTADSIIFDNGLEFSATNPEAPPLLTINIPAGLQYGATPGNISLDRASGTEAGFGLTVSPGQTIALVGGDLNLQGASLEALGGRIELGSVKGKGLVDLTSTAEGGWQLGYEEIVSFGDIQISRSFISTTIEEENESALPSSDGTIAFRASLLDIGRTSIVRTNTFTDFPGGDINIDVQNVTIRDAASVNTRTFSNAPGGNITVNASETVEIKDLLDVGEFGIFSSSFVTSSGSLVNKGGGGDAGNLTINTKRLTVQNGGVISATTFSEGKAGNLLVNASELVQLNGIINGLFSDARGTGKAGNITIITPTLQIQDGASIRTTTFSNSDAGNIILQVADSITLNGENSGLFANTTSTSSGNGGSIVIEPTKEIAIQEQAQIAVDSQGSGQGGDIELEADFLTLDRGLISAETISNQGGNLTLAVDDLLLLRNGSNISATAGTAQAGGDGGDINIAADLIVTFPQENSDITANAFEGKGGNIQIDTENIFGFELQENPNLSDITASSQFGLDGTVNIDISGIEPGQELIELPIEIVDVSQLIDRNLCSAGQEGEFIITGKGGLSPSPQDTLNTDAGWEDWRMAENNESNHQQSSQTQSIPEANNYDPNRVIEAQSWFIAPNGNIVLSARPVKSVSRNSLFPTFNCQSLDRLQP